MAVRLGLPTLILYSEVNILELVLSGRLSHQQHIPLPQNHLLLSQHTIAKLPEIRSSCRGQALPSSVPPVSALVAGKDMLPPAVEDGEVDNFDIRIVGDDAEDIIAAISIRL